MSINFDEMSLKEMRALRAKLDRAIETYEDRKRKEALAAAEEVAREYGFNLAELTSYKGRLSAIKAPKYAHPDDPNRTWSGRGRKPRWLIEQLEAGKTLEDLAI